jgi:DNA-binding response OmpR family regulator
MRRAEKTAQVLVVEDEAHIAAGLKLNLELEGFTVDVSETARQAAQYLARPMAYSVIVLDVMLPDLDGFDLCKRLRDAGNYTPIIMLTARGSPDDRVRGLEAGADDYLVKPFELRELLARIRSLIRRREWEDDTGTPSGTASATLIFGDARVEFDSQRVTVAGKPLRLTRLELELLRYFADHPDRVLTREELLESVWRLRNYPNTRTVDNFVLRLRKYFEPDPAHPVYFVSVRGSGYRFCPVPPLRRPAALTEP